MGIFKPVNKILPTIVYNVCLQMSVFLLFQLNKCSGYNNCIVWVYLLEIGLFTNCCFFDKHSKGKCLYVYGFQFTKCLTEKKKKEEVGT